jgi:S1-C subfamily serine protease
MTTKRTFIAYAFAWMLTFCPLVRAAELPDVLSKIRAQVVRIETPTATGTGFVIDKRGYIATNAHVILKKDWENPHPKVTVSVRFGPKDHEEEKRFECIVIGFDQLSDLAVVWLNPKLKTLDSEYLKKGDELIPLNWAGDFSVGEDVVAVGYAWGQSGSVSATKGIISATQRCLPDPNPRLNGLYGGLLQTDASINPGNSGGPLLNMRGEVVGVNTYEHDAMYMFPRQLKLPVVDEKGQRVKIRDGTGKEVNLYVTAPFRERLSRGVYYARSCRSAEPIVNQLIDTGKVERGSLGIKEAITISRRDAGDFANCARGVRIVSLEEDSPLKEAGMRPGDIIVSIHKSTKLRREDKVYSYLGSDISCVGDLNDWLASVKPGTDVRIYYHRPPWRPKRRGLFNDKELEILNAVHELEMRRLGIDFHTDPEEIFTLLKEEPKRVDTKAK